jgi:hypothetical protein
MEAIALPPGGGKLLQVLGNPWTIKAATDQTGGTFAALEGSFQPGSGELAELPPGPPEPAKLQEILARYDQESLEPPVAHETRQDRA